MKQLLEAIRAKYLCLHDWEVVSKTEYILIVGKSY